MTVKVLLVIPASGKQCGVLLFSRVFRQKQWGWMISERFVSIDSSEWILKAVETSQKWSNSPSQAWSRTLSLGFQALRWAEELEADLAVWSVWCWRNWRTFREALIWPTVLHIGQLARRPGSQMRGNKMEEGKNPNFSSSNCTAYDTCDFAEIVAGTFTTWSCRDLFYIF